MAVHGMMIFLHIDNQIVLLLCEILALPHQISIHIYFLNIIILAAVRFHFLMQLFISQFSVCLKFTIIPFGKWQIINSY